MLAPNGELELIPSGYVENQVGGVWNKEPVLKARQNGSGVKLNTGKGKSDDLAGLIMFGIAVIAVVGVVMLLLMAVHYGVKGVKYTHRKYRERPISAIRTPIIGHTTPAENVERAARLLSEARGK